MLQNKIKYTQKLFNYLQPPGNIFIKCLATSEPLVPVNLSFTTYETTSNNSSEPPFLILHGLFGSKQNWGSLCKAYHQKANPQRKIIALDLRNHGESEHSEAHSYAHMAADLNFFLKEQNIERMALMGHSMGGRCAMLFALKYPELVEKLIIVDISPVTSSPNMDEMPMIIKMMDRIEFPENVSLSQARTIVDSQLAKNISNSNLRAFILTNIVATENKRYKWRINLPVLAKTFDHVARFPLINNNLQYTGDTLFLGGGNSNFIPKSDYPKIKDLFPNAELRYIDGAGHWVHSEKPNEFLKITLDFLNKPKT